MTKELSYEETVELESNVAIRKEADKIYEAFLKNVKLNPAKYSKGRFEHWSDQYNATYFQIRNEKFVFVCEFLHESYAVEVTPAGIFSALKSKDRGVEHLISNIDREVL